MITAFYSRTCVPLIGSALMLLAAMRTGRQLALFCRQRLPPLAGCGAFDHGAGPNRGYRQRRRQTATTHWYAYVQRRRSPSTRHNR